MPTAARWAIGRASLSDEAEREAVFGYWRRISHTNTTSDIEERICSKGWRSTVFRFLYYESHLIL